jgi:hypothetical protein
MKVLKYPIEITDRQEINMPNRAKLIHVGYDPLGVLCVWAVVDERNKRKPVVVSVVGTGRPMTVETGAHLGSIIDGELVWHIGG